VSRGAGETGIFGLAGWSGWPTLTSPCVSSQWLVPLATDLGLGGGGTERVGVSAPCAPCPVLVAGGGVALAAIFSFLAFCRQSGQVTSLALADWNHLPQVLQRIFVLPIRILPCSTMNDIILRRNAFLSIGPICGFVYTLFVVVIELAGVHFCPDAYNDDYQNVSALLSKLLSKNGNRGASDQVFIVFGLGHFILMASQ
jgi:hypothetical protein